MYPGFLPVSEKNSSKSGSNLPIEFVGKWTITTSRYLEINTKNSKQMLAKEFKMT
jgi:hypothetical protein